jgi:adenine phosphoribosyltransferase
MSLDLIKSLIRDVPDFPKPGIVFKDITPVLQSAEGLAAVTNLFVERWRGMGIEKIVGIESRGFLLGAPVAVGLGLGLSLVRKAGKLPYERISRSYDLEYGSATLETHVDAVAKGERVVIVDDLLATGGTARATVELMQELGAEIVEVGFLVELGFLQGRAVLDAMGVAAFAPIKY